MNPDSTHLARWIRIWIEKYTTGSELKSSCERGLSSPCLKRGRGYVLTYDLYTSKFLKAEWSAAVLKLSHEL